MSGHRRFDHDDAVRRHAAGETYKTLAKEYGVLATAVYQAVKRLTDPGWAAHSRERYRLWQRGGNCIDCGADIIHVNGVKRCWDCANKAKVLATDTHAHCSTCKQWKPLSEFTKNRRDRQLRSVHSECRPCQTARRRAYREARKVPCVDCGQPTHSTAPGTGRRTSIARCHACSMKAIT